MSLWTRFWCCLGMCAIFILLVGCTTFGGEPEQIANWPKLRIIEHRVTAAEASAACQQYAPWWGTAHGCAIFYPTECHVWASLGTFENEIVAIERDNCNGRARPYWRARLTELRDKINGINNKKD